MNNQSKLRQITETQNRLNQLHLRIVDSDPWVPVLIRGKEYKLEYSFGAVEEVYRRTGITIGFDEISALELSRVDVLFPMLLAGLQTHHGDQFCPAPGNYEDNIAALKRMIPMKHRQYYVVCMLSAMRAAEPDVDDIIAAMDAAKSQEVPEDRPLPAGSTSDGSGPDVPILDGPQVISKG